MPIWLRKFTFTKIQNYYTEEQEAIKKARGNSNGAKSITTDGKVTSPEFLKNAKSPSNSKPNYTTKMSKK
jgi:hypothetical protein|tara:strand:+ start:338 stop:547 length:210 start_codon:yes stop_codon:yes gene_type:complete